jgi:hypothetical protein
MSTNELIDRELEAVDEALAAGAVLATDPAERRLQELALALRADAEPPDQDFAARLRERVEEGFPPEPWSARGRAAAASRELRRVGGRRPSRNMLQGLGIAGSLAVVLAVIAVALPDGSSGPTDDAGGGGGGGGGAAAPQAERSAPALDASGGDASPAGALPAEPPRQGRFRPGHAQRIERSASLTLAAPSDRLDRVADDVIAITDRYGGFVLRSSVTSGDDGSQGGEFALRIPADRLRPALRDLSQLGTVRSRTQSGRDVTAGFVTAGDRLEAARAERKGLLERLEQATTDTQADAIRRRLDLVAAEINRLHGRLRNLRLRTNYAAVSLSLEANDDSGAGGATGNLDDALDDALGSLSDAVGIAVRALGFAIPLGLLALIGWLATRAYRRRLRESALV